MSTLKQGAKGADVEVLQRMLNDAGAELVIDGDFGPATDAAVEAFQRRMGLIVDGVVGSATWQALGVRLAGGGDFAGGKLDEVVRVECDVYGEGYGHCRLRADAGTALERVKDELHRCHALLTTSGGLRSLKSGASASRSAKSMHYVGRAVDLYLYSGMQDAAADPYVVVREGERHWRVYARCAEGYGQRMTLDAWLHDSGRDRVSGWFVDLTDLMLRHGFARIGQRRNYPESYLCAEWWHYQYELGLQPGVTRFGDELLRLYTLAQLEHSAPWKHRAAIWRVDWS